MLENINYDLLENIEKDPEYIYKKYGYGDGPWSIPSVVLLELGLLIEPGLIIITAMRRITFEITFTGHVVLAWRRAHL